METITIQSLRVQVATDGCFQYYSSVKRRWFRTETLEQMQDLLAKQSWMLPQESAWYHLNGRWYTH